MASHERAWSNNSGDANVMAGPSQTPSLVAPPPDPQAFLDPLAAIEAEHDRQRGICDELDALTEAMALGPPLVARAGELLTFLTHDLKLHTEDEEQNLFPLLRERAAPGDRIRRILKQLSRGHVRKDSLATLSGNSPQARSCSLPGLPAGCGNS